MSCNLELIFLLQDCYHSRIAQVEYQGQTRYTEILDCKPLINTYHHLGYRLKLKYFIFTIFLLTAELRT